ncbi:YqcC family protein [Shewanella intestini]|uniref:YqcC family protein n=1 Tax=Shewanella intestini TaxID=2017544 RepID=A0ABS5HYB6_9GAMM|nr:MULTISPECIES: YqcC family protein [Shewanella]MBR9726780.1 YqcC family protein [Shewanella intestini]MRG34654.1 YqcC family protein [Shewanella sp. XMDDZSB0408]
MMYVELKNQLVELEKQLKLLQLWSAQAISAQALASTAPFACDTMTFEQWLQFIFIPKMQQLMAAKMPLPTNMAIAPMAEHVWQSMPERHSIIELLRVLDALVNQ